MLATILPSKISVFIEGEFKELGYIQEMSTNHTYEDYSSIGGSVRRVPLESTTDVKIQLRNPEMLSMFKDYEHTFKIQETIVKAFVKGYQIDAGIFENILRLELVVVASNPEHVADWDLAEFYADKEKLAGIIKNEFDEALL